MFKEFRDFINRGNVLDLAVAVIIGGAFSKIVTSLTNDVLMPLIGKVFGGLDFSSYFIRMGPVPPSYTGSPSNYAALKNAGVPLLGYGEFLTQAVNFFIVAFIVFLIVRTVSKAIAFEKARFEREKPQVETTPAPDAPDVALLRQILAELQKRP